MAIEQNKNYTLKGSQIEDLAGRVNDAQENALDALEGLSNKVDKETGKGLSTNDFTNSDKTKLDSVEANAQENTIESVSVNGTQITPDTDKNVDINVPAVENSLTSESTTDALSAAQGKTLKELIDNASGITELTEDDYSNQEWGYNNERIILWKLTPGVYKAAPKNSNHLDFRTASSANNSFTKGTIFIISKSLDNSGNPYEVVQLIIGLNYATRGTGGGVTYQTTTASGNLVRVNYNVNPQRVLQSSDIFDALNYAYNNGGAALSARQGRVLNENIGDIFTLTTTAKTSTVAAINELDSELDDVKSLSGNSAPTTSTEGEIGQFYIDTSTGDIYYLKSIDETTDPDTYNWTKLSTGTGVNVVQTTGTSTTDVMSQNAVTGMVYQANNKRRIAIGQDAQTYENDTIAIGYAAKANASGNNGAIQVGHGYAYGNQQICVGDYSGMNSSNSSYVISPRSVLIGAGTKTAENIQGAIALGFSSKANETGEMNIGSADTTYGYNNSNYRLLTGVYDPQSAHDAATKGYVDTNIPDAPDSADFNALFD